MSSDTCSAGASVGSRPWNAWTSQIGIDRNGRPTTPPVGGRKPARPGLVHPVPGRFRGGSLYVVSYERPFFSMIKAAWRRPSTIPTFTFVGVSTANESDARMVFTWRNMGTSYITTTIKAFVTGFTQWSRNDDAISVIAGAAGPNSDTLI